MTTMLRRWRRRLAQRAAESGYAAILVAIIVPTVGIGCAAVAVDTGIWFVMEEKVQKAADAAVLAGVPYLPQDFPAAKAKALDVAERNGFKHDPDNGTTITVTQGARSSQLKVTVSYVVENTFGSAIGVPTATINRSATADYQGPAPMGSPCNTFGNEPSAGTGAVTPVGSAQSSPPANCSRTPQLWGLVEGPESQKVNGDRYQNLYCPNSVDGCSGGKNTEYDDFGYVFVVKVQKAAVNKPIDLQLYDPMFVSALQKCTLEKDPGDPGQLPRASAFTAGVPDTSKPINPYATYAEAADRYSNDSPNRATFCPGDGHLTAPYNDTTTSFVLRQQTDSQNPKLAPVQNDDSGKPCIEQYGAFGLPSVNTLKAGASGYNDDVAASFHNWMSFCTFTPTRDGDYYLQVRTNVSMGGTSRSSDGLIRSGNAAAAALTGNTTSGDGSNGFSIRAVTQAGLQNQVAVSGFNHMPIFINADSATATFNLIRVTPGAAGQNVSFSYYDAGDADGAGGVTVLRPTDATGSIAATTYPQGCSAYGGSSTGTSYNDAEALTNCTAPFEKTGPNKTDPSKNNGKTETMTIPIPADYSCDGSKLSGCWFRVQIAFGGGDVHDVTTWDASVQGDPVRLLE